MDSAVYECVRVAGSREEGGEPSYYIKEWTVFHGLDEYYLFSAAVLKLCEVHGATECTQK